MFRKDNEFSRTLYEKFLVENSINAVTLEKNILREELGKENFEKIENGLDVVTQLEGHTFNWKKERSGERLSAGFKAQEVEKILPHLVDEKKLPLRADDDKEYKILRYEEMIPYLVEAIKEQQEEIELLKANLDQLKYNRR